MYMIVWLFQALSAMVCAQHHAAKVELSALPPSPPAAASSSQLSAGVSGQSKNGQ